MQKGNLTPLLLGIVIILLGALAFFTFSNKKTTNTPTGISGTFNVNGVVPQGATITVSQKPAYTQGATYEQIATNIAPQDQSGWFFGSAQSGKSYELQATLVVNGKNVYQSDPIFVTAPATEEVITLDVPAEAVAGDQAGNATISGYIGVNGYIPQGATITVQGKTPTETEYTTVAQGLTAVDKQFMSYTTAVAGQTYEVMGILYDVSGNQIGTSSVLTLVAPANNEQLNINSTAQPPVTPAPTTAPNTPTPTPGSTTISGNINFNGAAQSNTRIVVFQRVSGTGNFQVAVDNIQPSNNAAWSWPGAIAGTSYDLVAILKQRQSNGTDQDISDSNTMTVTAPASNETFTINSGFSLPAPGGTISFSCGNYNASGNNWSGSVNFQSVSSAQSYWFQVGSTNGGDDLTNQTANATNTPNQIQNLTFNNGTTYYARFAYANVANVPAFSSQFSPFSQTTSYSCNH